MKLFEITQPSEIKWPSTKEEVTKRLDKFNIHQKEFNIRDDLSVDIVSKKDIYIENIPGKYLNLRFNECKDSISFDNWKSLVSLEGCPTKVGGCFSITDCPRLTSLKYAPESVNNFYIADCDGLINLEGIPQIILNTHKKPIDGIIIHYCAKLSSLKGMPDKINCPVEITTCKALNSFSSFPSEFNSNFKLYYCGFTSLKGLSDTVKSINGSFKFTVSADEIKSGFLELMMLNHIGSIEPIYKNDGVSRKCRVVIDTILKYIKEKSSIFECQAELIEKGYESFL